MKIILALLLVVSVGFSSVAQPKKRGKVKRKYKKTEHVRATQPDVFIHGKVQNQDDELLVGALVKLIGTTKAVHTNADGEYFFSKVLLGRHTIQVSYMGYKTKSIDYTVHTGHNYINFTIDERNVKLDPIVVTAQKREQQVLDVPAAVSVIGNKTLENLDIRDLDVLSDFVPGLNVIIQSILRPDFVIRGLTSDEVGASAQPRVATYYNDIPVSRATGAAIELFDMKRVEVLKGPQGTLFGRGAQIGAIHFISEKPTNTFTGFLSAGFGDYGQKYVSGAINIPVIEDKLQARAAGVYDFRDGYVKNTFGGTLNGKNTTAGRFSLRFIPSIFTKIDLEVNYQKDDAPGTAFMSGTYPNTNGSTDIYNYVASLNRGESLANQRKIFGTILNARHYINEHTYFTSITSFRTYTAFAAWDGDGSAAEAINMSEDIGVKQITQELRYNYSLGNKLNGFVGASYWREKVKKVYGFTLNEQQMGYLFTSDPSMMVLANGQPNTITNLPVDTLFGSLAGMPLPAVHEEENISEAVNQSIEGFADATYNLTRKISITAGIRYIMNRFKLSNEALFSGGTASTLGMLTGNYPNLFFRPSERQELKKTFLAITGRANISYKYTENTTVFAGYAKGYRPNVLQFTSNGTPETLPAETVDSYDFGFKGIFLSRLWADLDIFYHQYKNFQTSVWVAVPEDGNFNYLTAGIDKASAYGGEASLKYAIMKQLQFFGNYAYIHARFNEADVLHVGRPNPENQFRLTPEHSFSVGLNASVNITPNIQLFAIPTYSYKSHFYFEDANTKGIEQDAYGILSARGGFRLSDPDVTLSVYANNLLNEKYLISGGNTGSMFGIPTFIPGAPRMIGTKLTWRF